MDVHPEGKGQQRHDRAQVFLIGLKFPEKKPYRKPGAVFFVRYGRSGNR